MKIFALLFELTYLIGRSDISNRARVLLSRWSKMLVRNQAVKYHSILNSSNGVQKDIIRKQRHVIYSDCFFIAFVFKSTV